MRRNTLRTFGLGAAALAMVLAVPACGGSGDEGKVRAAVSDYLDEVGEQDHQTACGFLHADARSKLGGDCATSLKQRYASLSADIREDLDDIDVDDVEIRGGKATVQNSEIRVESKSKTRRKGKTRTRTTYRTAPDVTGGTGFTLKKAGSDWRIASGV